MLVLPTLGFGVLMMIQPVLSVGACYFCADTASVCRQNLKREFVMDCSDFLVNEKVVTKMIRQPPWLVNKNEIVYFATSLSEKYVKAVCVNISYTFKPLAVTLYDPQTFNMNQSYTFRSCMYDRLMEFKDACHYFLQENFPSSVVEAKCTKCDVRFCNSGAKISLHNLIKFLTVILLIPHVLSLFKRQVSINSNLPCT